MSKFKSSNYIEMLKSIAPEISKSHVGELKSTALPDLKGFYILTHMVLSPD